MNHASNLRYVALCTGLVGLSAAVPGAVALYHGDHADAQAAGISVFLGAVVAALVLVLVPPGQGRTAAETTKASDLLVCLGGWWLLAPLIAMPLFIQARADGAGVHAYFEAVSCLTTTGASSLSPESATGGELSPAVLTWRGVLHFIGAVASLGAALTVLPALNFGGAGMHRSRLFTGTERGFLQTFRQTLRIAALVLAILIAVMAIALSWAGQPFHRALSVAVSTATTGLVDPQADLFLARSATVQAIVLVGLFLSSISFPLLLSLHRNPLALFRQSEAMSILAMTVVAGLIVMWVAAIPLSLDGFVWAASNIATSGIMTEPLSIGVGDRGWSLATTLAFVGGSALSTAGGLKMARVLILAERSRLEFSRLGFQHMAAPFIFRGRIREDIVVVGVWVYLVSYILVVAVLALLLSVGRGDFAHSLMTAIGSVSNAGHLITHHIGPIDSLLSSFGMIAGRLEVLALLPLFRRGFWSN